MLRLNDEKIGEVWALVGCIECRSCNESFLSKLIMLTVGLTTTLNQYFLSLSLTSSSTNEYPHCFFFKYFLGMSVDVS